MLKVGQKLFFGEKFPVINNAGNIEGERVISNHLPIYKENSMLYRHSTNLSDASISSDSIYSDQQENITQNYDFDSLEARSPNEEIDIFEFIHEEIIDNSNGWDDEITTHSNGVNMISISTGFENVNLSSSSLDLPMSQLDSTQDVLFKSEYEKAAIKLRRKQQNHEFYKRKMSDPESAEKLKRQKSEYRKKQMADPQKVNEYQKRRLEDPQKLEKKRQADRKADEKRRADPEKAEKRRQQQREYKERQRIKKEASQQAASALMHIA